MTKTSHKKSYTQYELNIPSISKFIAVKRNTKQDVTICYIVFTVHFVLPN